MKRFLPAFFVLTLSQFFTPSAFAQSSACRQTDLGCIPDDPIGFVQKFYSIGVGFIGMIALIFLIIGGYHVLTSEGDPEKLRTGKSYIFYSLAGLLLAVFGFVFFEAVAGVLKVPGFS